MGKTVSEDAQIEAKAVQAKKEKKAKFKCASKRMEQDTQVAKDAVADAMAKKKEAQAAGCEAAAIVAGQAEQAAKEQVEKVKAEEVDAAEAAEAEDAADEVEKKAEENKDEVKKALVKDVNKEAEK